LVGLGFRDHVELVLVLVLGRRGGRGGRRLRGDGGRGAGLRAAATAAATATAPARGQHERHGGEAEPGDTVNLPVSHGPRSYLTASRDASDARQTVVSQAA